MRKTIRITLFVVTSVIIFLLLRNIFPKNRGVLTFFLFYLFFDVYLWYWVKNAIRNIKNNWNRLLSALFWVPVLLLGAMVIYGFFYPFLEWNLYIKTYGISLFLCFLLCTFFPVIALLLADTLRFLQWIRIRLFFQHLPRERPIRRSNSLVTTGWVIGGIFFFLLLGGMIFWQYDFRVRREVVIVPDLPESFDGLRIVQFSDVHLGNWPRKDKLETVVGMINDCRPDVIFFTGDMFNYCTSEGYEFISILKKLNAPSGIFAVLGNHDYGEYIRWPTEKAKEENMLALERYYRTLGWTLLRNENRIMVRARDSIAILGVENWGKTRRFQRLGDVARALKGAQGVKFQVLLSHDPSYWEFVISRDYPEIDLTLSGHTHGGQVGINLSGLHWSPVSWFSTFWGGLYKNPASTRLQYLYVDEGAGCIGYSGRVGILPEITLLVLRQGRNAEKNSSE
jgi:predicted MPP superfamily phosphohydrolase